MTTPSSSEEEVVNKVRQLVQAMDRIQRYKQLVHSLPEFVIIVLVFVFVSVTFYLLLLLNYFITGGMQFIAAIAPLISFCIISAGIVYASFWMNSQFERPVGQDWDYKLKEGFPGALEILSMTDYESLIDDARIGKLGFYLAGLGAFLGYWFAIFVVIFFVSDFAYYSVFPIKSLIVSEVYIPLALSIPIAIVLSLSRLERSYREIWAVESLIWGLRWFVSEFGRAEFKT